MNHQSEFPRLLERVQARKGLSNADLAGMLNVTTNMVDQWRNGSRLIERNELRVLITCLKDEIYEEERHDFFIFSQGELTPEDQAFLDKLFNVAKPTETQTPSSTVDLSGQYKARENVAYMKGQYEQKLKNPELTAEERTEYEAMIAKADEILEKIKIDWDARDRNLRVIPYSTLESLGYIEFEENIIFTMIGSTGGAALGILLEGLGDGRVGGNSWLAFWVLVFITIILIGLLMVIIKHKNALKR